MGRGIIFNIQRYSVNDGPGIRTIVFFKGCSMQCIWCENPESIAFQPQIAFHGNRCINCGICENVCPRDAIIINHANHIDWEKCNNCGECVTPCPSEALEMIGRLMTVNEIMKEIKKDDACYKRSGGGITISGGEAASQFEFLQELLKSLKIEGYHVVIETNGYIKWESMEEIASNVDIVYFDIKGTNPEKHRQNTNVENSIILQNAENLAKCNYRVVFRIPIIPGFNDFPEDICRLDDFLSTVKAK
ncbi:MAG: glycyl-radical enzyme activating protein, partial [Spirochaetales bacterium]|nr:glycyl-radical enzyme activating protein [Spirochaetales bacterium]